jgi:hypothetical protein
MSSPISGITANSDEKDGDRNTKLLPNPSTDSERSRTDGRNNINFPRSFDSSMDKSKENVRVPPSNKPSKMNAPQKKNKVTSPTPIPKKKKGIFGGIFKKNKKNKDNGRIFLDSDGRSSGKGKKKILSPKASKKGVLLGRTESEASI